jgi:hypothetical protein
MAEVIEIWKNQQPEAAWNRGRHQIRAERSGSCH